MQPNAPLPPFNYHGYLPEGVHETTLEQLQKRLVFNPQRAALWEKMLLFMNWAVSTGKFSHIYIDGGFLTTKPSPGDIDVILQTTVRYSPKALRAMEPFFSEGLDTILAKYSVHLHFWSEGFPGGLNDFRLFFQYFRPQDAAPLGLKEGAKKGIVRIKL
jgi:hypothetical protein